MVLPGVLFVGEDERARVIAHLGPAAGWFVPRGIGDWSTEVSVVPREALTEEIRRATKTVMPEEQIPPAKYPLSYAAAQKSPLLAVASRLAPKLVEAGVRVHTIGVDRITSSFYYLAEGGGEDEVRIEGDLVASVGAMLGERADNASIERVLDGLVDRLVRAMSKDRVSELGLELAAFLPRAAADGSGMSGVDIDAFEAQLTKLVGESEKYTSHAREIADKVHGATDRRLDVPLFAEAKKVSMGPFELEVGTTKVALPTYERWTMSNPLSEPQAGAKPAAKAAPAPTPAPAAADVRAPVAATPRDPSKPLAPEDALASLDAGPAAAEKAAAERAAALKAASEKAAAEKRAAEEKAAAEKKAAEARAAAEKAAAEKAAAEKAAAEAAEKAAAEKAAAEKAAAEKEAAEKEAAEKAAAEKAAAEKAAAEKAAAEKAEAKAEKAADKAEKKADKAEKAEKAADKADKKASDKKTSDKKASDKKASEKKPDAALAKKDEVKSSNAWIAYLVAALVAAGVVWKFFLGH